MVPVSLSDLFEHPKTPLAGSVSQISLEDLFFASCRGGWPRCLAITDREAKLEIAKDYYRQIYQKDASAIDGVKRNPEWVRTLLWSYARNMATLAKKTSIYADVQATQNVTDVTLSSYISVLEKLFVLRDIDAWTPQIRSKTAIRSAKKHIFVDPSIGIAALGLNPAYFSMIWIFLVISLKIWCCVIFLYMLKLTMQQSCIIAMTAAWRRMLYIRWLMDVMH